MRQRHGLKAVEENARGERRVEEDVGEQNAGQAVDRKRGSGARAVQQRIDQPQTSIERDKAENGDNGGQHEQRAQR
jgi:hypothetical protein